MKGTIIQIKNGVGKVRGDDGRIYKFNKKTYGNVSNGQRLQRVEFPGDGDWTGKATLLDEHETSSRPSQLAQQQSRQGEQADYRFLNPYNFVRNLHPPQTFSDDADMQLLYRCPPPPHDRYVGLSGKIICRLENVSPLFVSDSHATRVEKDGHLSFRFFQIEENGKAKRAIPATSLRGMIRNVFESVTNSCYAIFDYDKRLSYHLPATDALKLVPGRVEQDEDGRWMLRLLPGTANLVVDGRPSRLYAGRVEKYKAIKPVRRRKGDQSKPSTSYIVDLHDLKHGDSCYALADEFKFPPVWNVRAVARRREDLPVNLREKQGVFQGYLAITNQNIETKRFERFFFRDTNNTSCPELVPITQDVRSKYNELIGDYQERHADEIKKRINDKGNPAQTHQTRDADGRPAIEAAFSRFIFSEKAELQHGDLVYAMLSGSSQAPRIMFIVPVTIPRVGYERKIAQLLPEHLWKCSEYDKLCPACRTFGWVYGDEKQDNDRDIKQPLALPKDKMAAYAGRLRFSYARQLDDVEPETFQVSLSILASPKPTTTRFYLKPSTRHPQDGADDYRAGYDYRDNVLRGRKFYRHHGHNADKNYWLDRDKREYRKVGKNSDQNRTVLDALAPGAKFEFSISYENFSQVELGALLWALQLEGSQYHRLGYGKPLGFGSVKIDLNGVTLYEMSARYQSHTDSGEHQLSTEDQGIFIERFKQAMGRAYQQAFEDLEHVKDILTLLSDPEPELPIHYPRTSQQPDPKGKNFEWFVGNQRNRDARYVLELPGDEDGFPLLDRFGKEKLI